MSLQPGFYRCRTSLNHPARDRDGPRRRRRAAAASATTLLVLFVAFLASTAIGSAVDPASAVADGPPGSSGRRF